MIGSSGSSMAEIIQEPRRLPNSGNLNIQQNGTAEAKALDGQEQEKTNASEGKKMVRMILNGNNFFVASQVLNQSPTDVNPGSQIPSECQDSSTFNESLKSNILSSIPQALNAQTSGLSSINGSGNPKAIHIRSLTKDHLLKLSPGSLPPEVIFRSANSHKSISKLANGTKTSNISELVGNQKLISVNSVGCLPSGNNLSNDPLDTRQQSTSVTFDSIPASSCSIFATLSTPSNLQISTQPLKVSSDAADPSSLSGNHTDLTRPLCTSSIQTIPPPSTVLTNSNPLSPNSKQSAQQYLRLYPIQEGSSSAMSQPITLSITTSQRLQLNDYILKKICQNPIVVQALKCGQQGNKSSVESTSDETEATLEKLSQDTNKGGHESLGVPITINPQGSTLSTPPVLTTTVQPPNTGQVDSTSNEFPSDKTPPNNRITTSDDHKISCEPIISHSGTSYSSKSPNAQSNQYHTEDAQTESMSLDLNKPDGPLIFNQPVQSPVNDPSPREHLNSHFITPYNHQSPFLNRSPRQSSSISSSTTTPNNLILPSDDPPNDCNQLRPSKTLGTKKKPSRPKPSSNSFSPVSESTKSNSIKKVKSTKKKTFVSEENNTSNERAGKNKKCLKNNVNLISSMAKNTVMKDHTNCQLARKTLNMAERASFISGKKITPTGQHSENIFDYDIFSSDDRNVSCWESTLINTGSSTFSIIPEIDPDNIDLTELRSKLTCHKFLLSKVVRMRSCELKSLQRRASKTLAKKCPPSKYRSAHRGMLSFLLKKNGLRKAMDIKKGTCCYSSEENNYKCSYPSLPYARHCSKHILYNVDQVLYSRCTAKCPEQGGLQCSLPTFDTRREDFHQLCPLHARSNNRKQEESSTDITNDSESINIRRLTLRKRKSTPSSDMADSKQANSLPSIGKNVDLTNAKSTESSYDTPSSSSGLYVDKSTSDANVSEKLLSGSMYGTSSNIISHAISSDSNHSHSDVALGLTAADEALVNSLVAELPPLGSTDVDILNKIHDEFNDLLDSMESSLNTLNSNQGFDNHEMLEQAMEVINNDESISSPSIMAPTSSFSGHHEITVNSNNNNHFVSAPNQVLSNNVRSRPVIPFVSSASSTDYSISDDQLSSLVQSLTPEQQHTMNAILDDVVFVPQTHPSQASKSSSQPQPMRNSSHTQSLAKIYQSPIPMAQMNGTFSSHAPNTYSNMLTNPSTNGIYEQGPLSPYTHVKRQEPLSNLTKNHVYYSFADHNAHMQTFVPQAHQTLPFTHSPSEQQQNPVIFANSLNGVPNEQDSHISSPCLPLIPNSINSPIGPAKPVGQESLSIQDGPDARYYGSF